MKSYIKYTGLNLIIISVLLTACNQNAEYIDADVIFTPEQQHDLIYSIIRYSGHIPPKANHQTKFEDQFDEHYQKLAARHKLELIHHNDRGEIFFLMTRPAPSLHGHQVAIAGKAFYPNFSGSFVDPDLYEEYFRTWKMERNELQYKSEKLFRKLIRGEDLTPYYSENSGEEEYIEFPNKHTRFDPEKRIWISDLEINHVVTSARSTLNHENEPFKNESSDYE